jgi:hypothetical protein
MSKASQLAHEPPDAVSAKRHCIVQLQAFERGNSVLVHESRGRRQHHSQRQLSYCEESTAVS